MKKEDTQAAPPQIQEIRDRFAAKIETLWNGNWSANKGGYHADEWHKLVDYLTLEEVEELTDYVREKHTGQYHPHLRFFWRCRKELQRKKKEDIVLTECSLCDGAGLVGVPAVRSQGQWFIGDITRGVLSYTNFPCKCGHGRKHRAMFNDDNKIYEACEFKKKCMDQLKFFPRFDYRSLPRKNRAKILKEMLGVEFLSINEMYSALIKDSYEYFKEQERKEKDEQVQS